MGVIRIHNKGDQNMWNNLNKPWQRAFELAWESYKNDTIPIGAVIADSNGEIIVEGRNRIFDTKSSNPLAGTYMAHAEMTAMMQLKVDEHPDVRSYVLYTTMEPCPMCFGTMLMMHIQDLRFAARDNFAGATSLKDKHEYIKNKTMNIVGGTKDIQAFQLILQTSFEYIREHSRLEEILDTWREVDKKAIELGKQLFEEDYFTDAISKNKGIGIIYNEVITRYNGS